MCEHIGHGPLILPLKKRAERFKRLGADMVPNPLGVNARGFKADAKGAQEGFHDLVPLTTDACKFLSLIGQEHPTIAPLLDQSFGDQTLEHLGYRRLRDTEPLSNVDLAGFAVMINQVGDQLYIVLNEFRSPIAASLTEAFDVRASVHQSHIFTCCRIVHLGCSRIVLSPCE